MGFLDQLKAVGPEAPVRRITLPGKPPPPVLPQRTSRDLCESYIDLDQRLTNLGWHPTSDFWLEQLLTFWRGGTKRFVARVGRRGGKTKTICRAIVNEILYGDYHVPQGDIGTYVIVSKDRADARDKITTIHQILEALKIGHTPTKDELIFDDFPVRVKSYVATIQSVVGMTSIGLFLDEVSRWRDSDTGANPAREVLASLRPSMKTMANAHEFMISSPWAEDDVHFHAVEEGSSERQYVVIAPTWVANPLPECSEEACRRDEPDEMIFSREFGAIPMPAGTTAFYDAIHVNSCMTEEAIGDGDGGYVAGMDLGFSRDRAALVIARLDSDGVARVVHLDEVAPTKKGLVFSHILDRFIAALKAHHCNSVMGDSHHKAAALESLTKAGIHFIQAPAQPSDAHITVKRRFAEGRVLVPKHRQLKKQLLSISSCPSSSGKIRMILPRTVDGHCDLAGAFVLAVSQEWAYSPEQEAKAEMSDEDAMYARALEKARPWQFKDGNEYDEDLIYDA